MRGKSLHHLGDLAGSHRQIEQMLECYAPPPQRSHVVRFHYDQRLTAQITLVRGLWLQGHADQALVLVEQMVTEGLALDHTLTLAHVLSDAACFIALWAGDLPLATRYTKMWRDHTTLQRSTFGARTPMLSKAKFLLEKGTRTTASRHCTGRSDP
jgi:hypothetical protein